MVVVADRHGCGRSRGWRRRAVRLTDRRDGRRLHVLLDEVSQQLLLLVLLSLALGCASLLLLIRWLVLRQLVQRRVHGLYLLERLDAACTQSSNLSAVVSLTRLANLAVVREGLDARHIGSPVDHDLLPCCVPVCLQLTLLLALIVHLVHVHAARLQAGHRVRLLVHLDVHVDAHVGSSMRAMVRVMSSRTVRSHERWAIRTVVRSSMMRCTVRDAIHDVLQSLNLPRMADHVLQGCIAVADVQQDQGQGSEDQLHVACALFQ